MTFSPPDDVNLFEAPRAEIGAGPVDLGLDPEAELVRRAHLGHEASVKSIGSLFYLGAIFAAIAAIMMLSSAVGVFPLAGPNSKNSQVFFGAFGAGLLAIFALYSALGYGLTHLQAWARWTAVALDGFWLLTTTLNALMTTLSIDPYMGIVMAIIPYTIGGYIMYLLVSTRGGVVFSPAYKEVIARTPHIKYRTSLIVKILLAFILGLIIAGFIAALMNAGR